MNETAGVAVVTGAASGIGLATSRLLEQAGHRVIGVDLKGAEIEANLSTPDGRDKAVREAESLSGGSVQKLVLAAGVGGHIDDARLVPAVNFFGAIAVLDGLRAVMRGIDGAAAVAVSSNSAQMNVAPDHPFVLAMLAQDEEAATRAIPQAGAPVAYGMSKHALARAVRARAAEWAADGIRLNAIAPGTTNTSLFRGSADHPVLGKLVEKIPIPLSRCAEPIEIARSIAFLLGDDASYVHGAVLWADGGTDAILRPDDF
jgi:NAD(P)-dependent dehydrogenase (short-subunit alcohol dehydrogenase family)